MLMSRIRLAGDALGDGFHPVAVKRRGFGRFGWIVADQRDFVVVLVVEAFHEFG